METAGSDKAADYRRYAEECRRLARIAQTEEQRKLVHAMAEAWERFAAERERLDRTKQR
jgi:dihydroneopterin aldolase